VANVLLDCVIMTMYFTGLAEFLRVFLGLPLSWGAVASDAAIATSIVGITLWLRTNFASEVIANTPASSEETAISALPLAAERLSGAETHTVPSYPQSPLSPHTLG
jgi:hypothetical protein